MSPTYFPLLFCIILLLLSLVHSTPLIGPRFQPSIDDEQSQSQSRDTNTQTLSLLSGRASFDDEDYHPSPIPVLPEATVVTEVPEVVATSVAEPVDVIATPDMGSSIPHSSPMAEMTDMSSLDVSSMPQGSIMPDVSFMPSIVQATPIPEMSTMPIPMIPDVSSIPQVTPFSEVPLVTDMMTDVSSPPSDIPSTMAPPDMSDIPIAVDPSTPPAFKGRDLEAIPTPYMTDMPSTEETTVPEITTVGTVDMSPMPDATKSSGMDAMSPMPDVSDMYPTPMTTTVPGMSDMPMTTPVPDMTKDMPVPVDITPMVTAMPEMSTSPMTSEEPIVPSMSIIPTPVATPDVESTDTSAIPSVMPVETDLPTSTEEPESSGILPIPSETPMASMIIDMGITATPMVEGSVEPTEMMTSIPSPSMDVEDFATPTPTSTEDSTGAVVTVDPASSPDVEDGGNEICVDASYLTNVPSHQLVHRQHLNAHVLCPEQPSSLPCATADHMVRINDQAMSYRRMCTDFITCIHKKMLVNSVLSHLWTETDHEHQNKVVRLTMLDARHPERIQFFLHRFISLGRRVGIRM